MVWTDEMVFPVFKDLQALMEDPAKTVFLEFLVSMESLSRAQLVPKENAVKPAHLESLLKLASWSLFPDQKEKRVLPESLVNQLLGLPVETEIKANKVLLVKWECLVDLVDLVKMVNLELLDLLDLLHQLSQVNRLLAFQEPLEKTVFPVDTVWTVKTVNKVLQASEALADMKVLLDSTVCPDPKALAQQRNALALPNTTLCRK